MKPLLALYLKELKDYRNLILVLAVATVALNVYAHWDVDLDQLAQLRGAENKALALILLALPGLPVLFFAIIPAFILAHSFSSEERANNHYLLFSLPVPKYAVGICKILGVLTVAAGLFAVSAGGASLMLWRIAAHPDVAEEGTRVLVDNLLLYAGQIFFPVVMLLLGMVTGMEGLKFAANRCRRTVTIGAFAVSFYLYAKLMRPAAEALDFLGGYEIPLLVTGVSREWVNSAPMPLPWAAYTLLAGLAFAGVGIFLYEKYVEI